MPRPSAELPVTLSRVNGEWVNSLPVTDRGLAYGDGLFETCRWQQGRVPLWPWHWERLQQSAHRLAIPLDAQWLQQDFNAFCGPLIQQGVAQGVLKLTLTRGTGGAGYLPEGCHQPSVIWQFKALNLANPLAQTGVSLVPSLQPLYPQPVLAGLKHLNRLDYILAAARTPLAPEQQLLLCSPAGEPIECLHHNLFWFKNGHLYTPCVQQAGVAGVFRQAVLAHLAPAAQVPVHTGVYPLQALLDADEVFMCNALRGIWPVKALESAHWAQWPLTAHLQSLETLLWHQN